MFIFKSLKAVELDAIIRNAAQKMKLSESIIEKDYWVCFVLNYLFNYSKWKESFTFKGGTSLSKCFSTIHRFSEDIDLIIDWRQIGYEFNEPWSERSNTKQAKFNSTVNEKTEEFIRRDILPKMNADFDKILKGKFELFIDENDKSTILFRYPNTFQSEYLTPSVRLEFGALAAWLPSDIVGINPDIQQFYPTLFEGDNIEVRAVLPERTFWEKATILHHEFHRPLESKMPTRYARHYYDLYCLSKSEYKDKALINYQLLKEVAEFKKKFYPRKWANYELATIDEIRLAPPGYRIKEIQADYENMKEMFFGEAPKFEEIMFEITKLENEIHNIKQAH